MPSIVNLHALIVIFNYWSLVVGLVNRLWMEYLLNKYQNHWLIQLENALDLHPLEQGCAAYHKGNGKGSAVIHSVPKLVRALLVKYLYDLSYRQTEEKIDCHLLVKWFVGYGLFDLPPDHTTLQRFEIWVLNHQPQLFFVETLNQIKVLDPLDWEEGLQVIDTFAMLARAAKGRLIPLIRDCCRNLLNALEMADPGRHALISSQIDQIALFGKEGDKPTRALKAEERAQRLQTVVTQALKLHQVVSFSLAQSLLPLDDHLAVEAELTLLHKIIFDETKVTETDRDEPQVTERKNGQKGTYRVVALNDKEATFRHHGADKGESAKIAYNDSILTGSRYVHWTQADTGARPDNDALPELLQAQYDCFDFWPEKMVGDQTYGYGKVRAAVEEVSGGQTQVVALLPNTEKNKDRYGPLKFTFDPEALTLTCPNDILSDKFTDKPKEAGRDFRFTYKMCQDCPLMAECRLSDAKPKSQRRVFISYYRPYNLDALAYNKTEQFKVEIKQRPIIERIIYNLTNIHGARRAKSTGLAKANFQLRMTSMAFNIRQLMRRQLKLGLAAA